MAPTILQTYPATGDQGIPVGVTIIVYFSSGVDKKCAQESIVLYGSDFDQTSGPGTTMWLKENGDNPFFLRSPGFKGVAETNIEFAYCDPVYFAELDNQVVTSLADEVGKVYAVKITPKSGSWAANTLYTLAILGNPDNLDVGISSRTVFDVVTTAVGNGTMSTYGSWTGSLEDTIVVKITTAGDIGVAKYKWWKTSEGEASAVLGRVTSRRFRTLSDGLQVKFDGSGFAVDDLFVFEVQPISRLADSYQIQFLTNDGSFSEAPDSPSTPATTIPPITVLPGYNIEDDFAVESMSPEDGAYNVSISNRMIQITFNQELDADSITEDSVELWNYPASGPYADTTNPKKLQRTTEVVGNVLTIRF